MIKGMLRYLVGPVAGLSIIYCSDAFAADKAKLGVIAGYTISNNNKDTPQSISFFKTRDFEPGISPPLELRVDVHTSSEDIKVAMEIEITEIDVSGKFFKITVLGDGIQNKQDYDGEIDYAREGINSTTTDSVDLKNPKLRIKHQKKYDCVADLIYRYIKNTSKKEIDLKRGTYTACSENAR